MNSKENSKLKSKLCDVSLEKCILVELINEKDENDKSLLHIAFLNWLDDADAVKNVDQVIVSQKEISMYWTHYEVSTITKMRKKLKDSKYSTIAVRVIAYGDYCSMANKLKNLEAGYKKTPLKTERSAMKRKVDEDFVSTDKKIKPNKETAKKINKTRVQTQSSEIYLPKTRSVLDVSALAVNTTLDLKKTIEQGACKSTKTRQRNYRKIYDSSESDNDTETKSMSNEEKDSQCIETVGKTKSTSDNNEVEFEKAMEDVEIYNDKDDWLHQKQHNENCKNNINQELVLKSAGDDDTDEFEKLILEKDAVIDRLETKMQALEEENNSLKAEIKYLHKSLNEEQISRKEMIDDAVKKLQHLLMKKPSTSTKDYAKAKVTEKSTKIKKEVKMHVRKDETSFKIPSKLEKELSKETTIKGFANKIISDLFDPIELAESSVTGVPSNACKDKSARPALDPERLNAARNLCGKYFSHVKGWRAVFNQAAAGKCSAARKKSK